MRFGPQYRFLVGGIIIAVAIAFLLFTNLRSSTVYYLTVKELKAQGADFYGQQVRVAGIVNRDTVYWEARSTTLRFDMIEGDETLPVIYEGPVPDAFAQSETVVVEGEHSPQGIFLANTLIVQCPSRYEGQVAR